MQTHRSSYLEGPVTKSRPWWKKKFIPSVRGRTLSNCQNGGEGIDPEFRAGLVADIRRQLAAGTYVTAEKWDIACCRLWRQVESAD